MMDMTAEAMQKTLDIANPEIHQDVVDSYGVKASYATKALHQIKAAAFDQLAKVKVSTLNGLANLVTAKLDDQDFSNEFLIHIEDETTVALKSRMGDEYGRRLSLVVAQPVPFDRFHFGQWMTQEEFSIAVAALFADTPDKDYVLKMASTLTNDAIQTTEDDGFTQRVNVKAGLRLKEPTTLKPRVDLAPYRTFPEVAQPVSSFVFRARCPEASQPMLMLVEADGGRWKVEAMNTLREAMGSWDLNIPIIT